MEKSPVLKYVIVGVTGLAIGIAIGWGLLKSGTKTTDIKWKFGNNELAISLDQDLTDFTSALNKMFSTDFSESGTLNWLKTQQGLFKPKDPELVGRIAQLSYEDLVSKQLRELSYKRSGPWAYQIDSVEIGIPSNGPKKSFAYVCVNKKYRNQKIRLFNVLDYNKQIVVEATGHYDCPSQVPYPDIQLNSKDAKELLGTDNFSKYETVMALIISDN